MKILIEESVLRQALEKMNQVTTLEQEDEDTMYDAITALRTALDAAEKVEPVAWMYSEDTRGGTGVISFERLSHYSNETPLYTHPAPAIPEGWQLVPNVATDKMYFAFSDKYGTDFDQAYEAMLQAAPAVPSYEESKANCLRQAHGGID